MIDFESVMRQNFISDLFLANRSSRWENIHHTLYLHIYEFRSGFFHKTIIEFEGTKDGFLINLRVFQVDLRQFVVKTLLEIGTWWWFVLFYDCVFDVKALAYKFGLAIGYFIVNLLIL